MNAQLTAILLCLSYPQPGRRDELGGLVETLPVGAIRSELQAFVAAISLMEQGDWEELHTRTLDLSPQFVPYVGHVVWGESYRRGAFMADLQRAQLDAGIDQRGELPDHLAPVLAYVGAVDEPLGDLLEVLPQAVAAMRKELGKADPGNPYRHVLAAAATAVDIRLAEGASV